MACRPESILSGAALRCRIMGFFEVLGDATAYLQDLPDGFVSKVQLQEGDSIAGHYCALHDNSTRII